MQQTAASLLYEGLFHLDGQFTPQPLLCASYTYDPEALTYVLTLRQGVVFSDGSPLTAADVKATLTAARSSARYAPRLADVKSISAGNGTVTLTLSRPNSALPALLDIPILKSGTEKKDIPTGTGPYLYDESNTPCLLASQNWWQGGGQPVERIVLTETADAESMLYRFTSHDVQLLVSDLTGTDSVTVSGSVRCTDADTTVFQYLGINTTVKPLDDAAFRRCLSLGLNRQALVSGLLSGHARAAQFPVSPVSPLYPSELDTAFSATAFADALAACETRPTRTLRLVVNSENAFKVSVAHQIVATFTTSGIPIEAVSLPWAEYTGRAGRRTLRPVLRRGAPAGGLGRFLPAGHQRQPELRRLERRPVQSAAGSLPQLRRPGDSAERPVPLSAGADPHPAGVLKTVSACMNLVWLEGLTPIRRRTVLRSEQLRHPPERGLNRPVPLKTVMEKIPCVTFRQIFGTLGAR